MSANCNLAKEIQSEIYDLCCTSEMYDLTVNKYEWFWANGDVQVPDEGGPEFKSRSDREAELGHLALWVTNKIALSSVLSF